jgi:hypothetical protein
LLLESKLELQLVVIVPLPRQSSEAQWPEVENLQILEVTVITAGLFVAGRIAAEERRVGVEVGNPVLIVVCGIRGRVLGGRFGGATTIISRVLANRGRVVAK